MNGAALARCASNAAARSTWSGAMLHVPFTSRLTLRIARRIASTRRTWVSAQVWVAEDSRRKWMYTRSEEHTSELQSLIRISYDVLSLTKQTKKKNNDMT